MLKMLKLFGVVLALGLMVGAAGKVSAKQLSYSDSYLGIVKIYTYYQDEHYSLTPAKIGSGVIINSNGLILTNEHVVTVKNSLDEEVPVTYQVCIITDDPAEEPECKFLAELVSKDSKNDVALLRIKKGLDSRTDYDYLSVSRSNSFHEGDSVTSLGYPSSGGDTITGSKGTITGSTTKYSVSWIKTDAYISYGSSGGALIDINGKLLGITSAMNSDVGYVINMTSVNSWVDANSSKSSQTSILADRMWQLMSQQVSLKSAVKFTNDLPKIEFSLPDNNWKFKHASENSISTFNDENSDGGFINITWIKGEILFDSKALDALVKFFEVENSCYASGDTVLAGKTGKKIVCPVSGEEINEIIVGSKNYAVITAYYNGKDKIDQYMISQTLQNLVISDQGNQFIEQRSYENKSPYFKLQLPNNWALTPVNDTTEPVTGSNIDDPNLGFSFYVGKLTDGEKDMSNQSYFNYIRDGDLIKLNQEKILGLKGSRYYESTSYKINDELTNEIFSKYRFKDENDSDKVKAFAAGYRIRDNDKILIIDVMYIGENEQDFEKYLKDFQDNVLINLTLGRPFDKKVVIDKVDTQASKKIAAKAPAVKTVVKAKSVVAKVTPKTTVVKKVTPVKAVPKKVTPPIKAKIPVPATKK